MPTTLLLESFSVKHTAGGPGPRSGLVGSQAAYAAVGPLLVVEADPVGDGDARFGESVELFAVEALVTKTGIMDSTSRSARASWGLRRPCGCRGWPGHRERCGDKLRAVAGADTLRRRSEQDSRRSSSSACGLGVFSSAISRTRSSSSRSRTHLLEPCCQFSWHILTCTTHFNFQFIQRLLLHILKIISDPKQHPRRASR